MKKLVFKRNGTWSLNNKFHIDESKVYTRSFINELNSYARTLIWHSDYINELYIYFFMKIKKYERLFSGSKIDFIQDESSFKLPWTVFVAAKNVNVSVEKKNLLKFHLFNVFHMFISFFCVLLTSLTYPLIALFKKTSRSINTNQNYTVIRSPASFSKLKFLEKENQTMFYYDDLFELKNKRDTMYANISKIEKFYTIFLIPYLSMLDFIKLSRDAVRIFGMSSVGYVQLHYALKIAHKCLYEYYLSKIIKSHNRFSLISGHKEDRFAVVDEKLCKKNSIKLICIPHGVEYSFYVPTGLPGNLFYCTTKKAAKYLNVLYQETKFIFDKSIAVKMYSVKNIIKSEKRIVFFTEANHTAVNVNIIQFLICSGYTFFVKLHPKDKQSNYLKLSDGYEYINDFDDAISNNICLARKSTVLVEALYNSSFPIAVVIDSNDRSFVDHFIPSLLESGISRVETTCALDELLKSIINTKYQLDKTGFNFSG